MLPESNLFAQVCRFQKIPDPRGKVGGHGWCKPLCSVGLLGSWVFGNRALGAVAIAVAALGSPLVLAALALVLIFFQDLNGTDVGPFAGNRAIAGSCIATAIAFVTAGFLPGKRHFGNTDLFTHDFIEMLFEHFPY